MLITIWGHLSYFLKDFFLYLILLPLSFLALVLTVSKVYKSKASESRKKTLIVAVFTTFVIILIYSGFEAYFRYRYDESDGLGFLQVDKRWHKRHDVLNSYYYRDRNFEENKKEGVMRVGVIGDSITEGSGIRNPKDRFSDILEQKLKDAGKNVEVYNLGKSGLDTVQEARAYQDVKHLKFDILVWEYFINDVQPENSTGTPIIIKNSLRGKLVTFLSEKSFFFDYIYWRFSSKYSQTIQELRNADIAQYHNEPVLQAHEKRISDFIESLKADNTKIVVIFFPSLYLLNPNYLAKEEYYMMVDYFKEKGVDATVDLLPELMDKNPKTLMASRFDTHPNEIVHALAAEKLFQEILPFLP